MSSRLDIDLHPDWEHYHAGVKRQGFKTKTERYLFIFFDNLPGSLRNIDLYLDHTTNTYSLNELQARMLMMLSAEEAVKWVEAFALSKTPS